MDPLILHHYPASPIAEKVRVALGIKQLAWHSVTIPMIMPKPDLMPLTGGYRKTPVLQIGADIYCDSQLILRELERRHPERSLYAGSDAGTANALAFWSDRSLFATAAGYAFATSKHTFPPEFFADRSRFSGREIDTAKLKAMAPFMLDQLRAQLGWYDTMLADGRQFMLGEQPTLVDCAAYHLCWFIRTNAGDTPPLTEMPRVRAWMDRIAALGHGKPSEMDSKEALRIARQAQPQVQRHEDGHDPLGRKPGSKVIVVPDDSGKDPVAGELIASSRDEIVILREDEQVGQVAVHFPRAGFVVQPGK